MAVASGVSQPLPAGGQGSGIGGEFLETAALDPLRGAALGTWQAQALQLDRKGHS